VAIRPTRTPAKAPGSGSTTAAQQMYPRADVTIADAGLVEGAGFGTERVKVHLVVTDASSAQRTTLTVRWFANDSVKASESRTFNGAGTFDVVFQHVYETCGVKPSASASITATPAVTFMGTLPVDLPTWLCVVTGPPPQLGQAS
jgi:hypothetical protein